MNKQQEAQLSLGWVDRTTTTYIRKPASDFGTRKENNFSKLPPNRCR